jgi:trehalose 6-phosphate synthase/phosphatase
MSRLLLVSNRLPITVKTGPGGLVVERSPGGLATGLAGLHSRTASVWIGWPGDTNELTARQRDDLDLKLAELGTVPIHLTNAELRGYYERFSNGVVWPLFHLAPDRIPLRGEGDFETYRHVNQRFADATIAEYRASDSVWVHDYHLALVPGLLRDRIPEARVGFFLHIPFPPADLFRILPCREAILAGMLGADLIGFHTASYTRHFETALQCVLGLTTGAGQVSYGGRSVRLGTFPMGIDARGFAALARSAVTGAAASGPF